MAGRTHDVIAVVPDAAVRVVLLEFDTLPTDSEEAAGRGALSFEEISAV